MSQSVYVYPNELRDIGLAETGRVIRVLKSRGAEVYLRGGIPDEKREELGALPAEPGRHYDFAVVLGGDGTVIRAEQELYGTDTPILGIHLGHLGYMTEVAREDAEEALNRALDGRFTVSDRMMLKAELRSESGEKKSFFAINDLVLRRSDYSGAIRFTVMINGEALKDFVADGIILATPNGSTAYNLSSGGPILSPTAENIIVTPLCSHSMLDRSIVLAGTDRVTITFRPVSYQDAPLFSADGYKHERLDKGCRIEIGRADSGFRLMQFTDKNFYSVLREKMGQE